MESAMKSKPKEHSFGIGLFDIKDHELSQIEKSLDSLLLASKDYRAGHVGVVTSYFWGHRHMNHTLHLSNLYTEKGLYCKGTSHLSEDTQNVETEVYQQLIVADVFVKMYSGQTVSPDFFQTANLRIKDNDCAKVDGIWVFSKKFMRNKYHEFGNFDKAIKFFEEVEKSKNEEKTIRDKS